MPRTSRGRGTPLRPLWHRKASRDGDGGHVPAAFPPPSSQERPLAAGWDGAAQPGPWWATPECLCSNPRAGGRWGARHWAARAEESRQGNSRTASNTAASPSPRPSSPHAQPEPASSHPGVSPAGQAPLPGSCQKAFLKSKGPHAQQSQQEPASTQPTPRARHPHPTPRFPFHQPRGTLPGNCFGSRILT